MFLSNDINSCVLLLIKKGFMEQYFSLVKEVLKFGAIKEDRTGIGTISKFGTQTHYDLNQGFPIVTTKKVHFKSIVYELLWFIKGQTNIKYLVDNNIKIWNEWPYEKFRKSADFNGETLEEFVKKIQDNQQFATKHGDLGPIYGKQWRDFNGFDQLKQVIHDLKHNKNSRRIILNAWNPPEISQMALPPCHAFVQFYVENDRLSCQLYQRSADIFLGVPFNISSYALLTYMLAQVCDLNVGSFIHTIGDAHIYLNHQEQLKLQLKRKPKKLPSLILNSKIKDLFSFNFEDIMLQDYVHDSPIVGKVAV